MGHNCKNPVVRTQKWSSIFYPFIVVLVLNRYLIKTALCSDVEQGKNTKFDPGTSVEYMLIQTPLVLLSYNKEPVNKLCDGGYIVVQTDSTGLDLSFIIQDPFPKLGSPGSCAGLGICQIRRAH